MSTQYETQGYTINNAGRRLVVDPITRIEGHMRCEVNINDQNVITNAVSCGTMFRGLEIILQGRDPRDAWAFVERICGVCTGVHALASVYAIEDAIGIKVPDNANIIRNIMLATLWCHDHLVHFYQLAGMDWIDVLDALKADPRKTSELAQSLSSWPKSSPGYFFDVQNRLKKFVEGGQLGIDPRSGMHLLYRIFYPLRSPTGEGRHPFPDFPRLRRYFDGCRRNPGGRSL